jgi:hypothetical protein
MIAGMGLEKVANDNSPDRTGSTQHYKPPEIPLS